MGRGLRRPPHRAIDLRLKHQGKGHITSERQALGAPAVLRTDSHETVTCDNSMRQQDDDASATEKPSPCRTRRSRDHRAHDPPRGRRIVSA